MPTYRTAGVWGPGIGVNLTPAMVDANFYELRTAIDDLIANPPTADSVVSVSQSGFDLTFHTTLGNALGPLTMPVVQFGWRGEWSPFTLYEAADTFIVTGAGLFTVMADHTSAATFDPDATGGSPAEALYNQLFGVGTNTTLDDLSDVSAGSPVAGQVLRYIGGSPDALWQPDTLVLDDLGDVSAAAPSDGDVLTYQAGSPTGWIAAAPAAVPSTLDSLTDVSAASPSDGDFLQYDAGSPSGWKNQAGTAISSLGAATLPVATASLLEISEASGSPITYASKQITIANLFASPVLTGTPVAPTAAPGTNNTQLATTAYADAAATAIIAAADAMVFKGVIDASTNPNYPAADGGHTYRVSVAGKIGGASGPNVEAGDILICLTDGTASGDHATVGASWSIVQANLDGAVIGPASAVDSRIAAFDGTTGKLLKDGGILTSAIIVSGGALGTPASGSAANLTGLPIGGIAGLGTGVATALAINVGSAGAPVVNGGTFTGGTLSGTTTLTGMTAGSVLFAGASSVLSQDNANLFYDSTNIRLRLGINTELSPSAGSAIFTVYGPSARSRVELAANLADATATTIGDLAWSDKNNPSATDKRIAAILGQTEGTTATNRGGRILFATREDGAAGPATRAMIDKRGTLAVGITADLPSYSGSMVGALLVNGAVSGSAGSQGAAALAVTSGAAATAKNLKFGVDTSVGNGIGWLQYTFEGTAHSGFALNPSGGNVGVGTTLPQSLLHIGTTAATARIYNSFTDASNGEWAYLGSWGPTANVATYGTDKNGTGTARNIQFYIGGTNKLDYGITVAGGWTTPDPFKSSKITTSDTAFMHNTSAALANGAAAQTGTLTNAPAAGDPTKWIPINDNGTTRYIPAW